MRDRRRCELWSRHTRSRCNQRGKAELGTTSGYALLGNAVYWFTVCEECRRTIQADTLTKWFRNLHTACHGQQRGSAIGSWFANRVRENWKTNLAIIDAIQDDCPEFYRKHRVYYLATRERIAARIHGKSDSR